VFGRGGPGLNASLPLMAPDLGIDGVAVRVTTRLGGVSAAPFASLNLADHVNDESQRCAD
jgi:copper oxidase (laccase) domain-containing protein